MRIYLKKLELFIFLTAEKFAVQNCKLENTFKFDKLTGTSEQIAKKRL
jgi:hypothetical protein